MQTSIQVYKGELGIPKLFYVRCLLEQYLPPQLGKPCGGIFPLLLAEETRVSLKTLQVFINSFIITLNLIVASHKQHGEGLRHQGLCTEHLFFFRKRKIVYTCPHDLALIYPTDHQPWTLKCYRINLTELELQPEIVQHISPPHYA